MNASSLWAGTEYAWAEYRPRGSFPIIAQKVKVIKVTKAKIYGNQNASTNVQVEVLTGRYSGTTQVVKARDIVNFWNEYVDERDHRAETARKEQEEREARRAKEREDGQARAKKEAEENQLIAKALEEKGFMPVGIRSMSSTIVLDRANVMSWLGLDVH